MIQQAVIVIPHHGTGLPGYLFGSVAGLPFLIRQILGLKRAGIAGIFILSRDDHVPTLEQELSRYRHLIGTVAVRACWPEAPNTAGSGPEAAYTLLLPVNYLPTPAVFSALRANLPAPGGLSLGVIPRAGSSPALLAAEHTSLRLSTLPMTQGPDSGSISNNPDNTATGWEITGLCLFSAVAWQEWLLWPKPEEDAQRSAESSGASFSAFIAGKSQQSQVRMVCLDPAALISVKRDEERAAATARLIALQNNSPLSEGILEKSWNRPLARVILPWLLERPVTPNQITLLSFLVGLLAVWGFAHGSYAASVGAGLLLPLILVLDCLDGAVARLKYQESSLGALLDLHGDSVVNLLIFIGISIGCYRSTGQPLFLVLGVCIVFGYITCWRLVRPTTQAQTGWGQQASKTLGDKILDEAISRDFFYIILLMAIWQRLTWLVMALAVGTNLFAWLYSRRQADG